MSLKKRMVIKIGSSLLVNPENLTVRYSFIHGLLSDIADLRSKGWDVILASSGSVALGLKMIKKAPQEAGVLDKQAAAACGQPILLNAYKQLAMEHGLDIAQVLVTIYDMEDRRSFLNTRNTMLHLFENNILPILNENDTVATKELKVGDNDRLAAKAAQMVQADYLVLLTNVDGLYTDNPDLPESTLIRAVEDVSQYLEVTSDTSALGSGGMFTKMQAANMAQNAGCTTIIGRGIVNRPISSLLTHERPHTRCHAIGTPDSSWKVWLTNRLQVAGSLILSNDLADAITKGHLDITPKHILNLQGEFLKGDVVHIFNEQGEEIARGLTNFSAQEIELLMRYDDDSIINLLGVKPQPEVVSYDNIIILEDHHITWDAPLDLMDQIDTNA